MDIQTVVELIESGYPVREVSENVGMSPAWVRGFVRDRGLKPKPTLKGRSRAAIRNFLIAYRGHRCEECGITRWHKKPVPIHMHHKDGNTENNALDNLILLCVNCHALTPNFGAKNRKK